MSTDFDSRRRCPCVEHFLGKKYKTYSEESLSKRDGGLSMTSKKLLDLLNQAIGMELQVSIQYMWQHVLATGIDSTAVADIFKEFAITEMKHAEAIAERLAYIEGTPTTKPAPIFVGGTLKEMLQTDVKAEEMAIALYKQIIKAADGEGDVTTRKLVEGILGDEEGHHDTFTNILA
jgi:bacterioferritin